MAAAVLQVHDGGAVTNFLTVLLQVAILFVMIGVGVVARWRRLVDAKSVTGLVNVLVVLVTPALIVDVFQRPFDPAMLNQFALAFLLAIGAHIALIAVSRVLARGDARTRPVLRLAMVFSNAGFMGIPLEQAILGSDGVFFGIVYVSTFNLFMWSWGILTMRGGHAADETAAERRKRLRTMLVNPGTVGIAIGLPLFLLSITLPRFIAEPVHEIAALNTPLAMIVIGYYLYGARLGAVLRNPFAHLAAAVRLLLFPLLFLALLWMLRGALDRTMSLALLIGASAPVAALVAVFAVFCDRDVDMGSGLVCGSTLASIVTMPFVLAIAMAIL